MSLSHRHPASSTEPTNTAPGAHAAASSQPQRLVIDTAEMAHLLAQGKAQYLSRIVRSFARHDGHWWLDNTTEWLRITDEDYATQLNKLADQ